MKKLYLPLVVLAFAVAGCSNDDDMPSGVTSGNLEGTAMKVTTLVEVPQTRGTMTTDNLEQFYLRVTDAGGTTSDYNYLVLMQKDGSEWVPGNDTELWWAGSDAQVSAVYQGDVDWSDSDVYDTGGQSVSVQTDQSSEANVQESDLLYMKPVAVSPTDYTDYQTEDGSVKVTLTHRFALLNINIAVSAEDDTDNPIESVTVGGTATDATYIPAAALGSDLTLGATTNDITAHEVSYENGTASYECIILPQDLASGSLTITAQLGDGQHSTYIYTYESSDDAITRAEGNMRYTFNLSLALDKEFSLSSDVEVNEWGEGGSDSGDMDIYTDYVYDSSTNTYIVYTAEGLLAWNALLLTGSNSTLNLTLAADIDMTGKEWTTPCTGYSMYSGTIDGAGHTISNLTINGGSHTGFIGQAQNATIRNLQIANASVTGSGNYTGGIVATCNNVSIIGCSFSGTVNGGGRYAGGIAGFVNDDGSATITACYSNASVSGNGYVGCLIGFTYVDYITNACYWDSSTTSSGVGAGTTTTTQVDNSTVTWSDARDAMNQALSEAGSNYRYTENTDEVTKDDLPLVLVAAGD